MGDSKLELILLSPWKKDFNWYDCGFYFFDGKVDKIKMSTKVNFYSEKEETVYILNEPTELVIGEDIIQNDKCSSHRLVCCKYKFYIDKSRVKEVEELKNSIIQYSRRYNNRLKKEISDFPSCKEISNNNIGKVMKLLS